MDTLEIDYERTEGNVPNLPNMHLDSPLVPYKIAAFFEKRKKWQFTGDLGRIPEGNPGELFHRVVGELLLMPRIEVGEREWGRDTHTKTALRNVNATLGFWDSPSTTGLDALEAPRTLVHYRSLREKLEDFVSQIAAQRITRKTDALYCEFLGWTIEHQHGYVLFHSGKRYTVGDYDHLLMYADIISQRTLMYEALNAAFHCRAPGYPSADVADSILLWGDRLLSRHGCQAYQCVKEFEGICVSRLHHCPGSIEVGDPSDYAKALRTSLIEQAEALADPSVLEIFDLVGQMTPDESTQIFGLYRFWGHPQVWVVQGITANRKVSCARKEVDPRATERLHASFHRMFLASYVEQHGRLPNLITEVLTRDHPVLHALRNGGKVSKASSVDELIAVRYRKTLDPTGVTVENLLSDKALGLSRTELTEACRTRKKGDWKSRRALYAYLHTEEINLYDFLQDIDLNGLPEEVCTIGVTPKERELKIKPRLFSLLTKELKYYFGTTEYLLGKRMLRYFPQITMTDSLQDVTKKVQTIATQMSRHTDKVTVVLNLDFEKWNMQMRNDHTREIFSRIDELFGFGQVFSRTHDLFKQCLFYCFDGYNWPEVDRGTIRLNELAWTGQEGGVEGLRQKGWTIVTVCAVDAACSEEGVPFSLVGQGDNQVLAFHFDIAELDPLTGGPTAREYTRIKEAFKVLKEKLYVYMSQIGLPIKTAESWSSSRVFTYGKNPYFEGVARPMSIKKLARMLYGSNDGMQSIYSMVAGIFAAGQGAASADYTFVVAYIMSYIEASRCLTKLLRFHPLLGGSMLTTSHQVRKGGLLFKTVVPSDVVSQVSLLMMGHVTVGGLPVASPLEFMSRGFPDPLSAYLTWLELVRPELSATERVIAECWSRPVEQPGTPEMVLLLEDPLSLNIISPTRPSNILRSASAELLARPGLVRNQTLNQLLIVGRDREPMLVDLLSRTSPLVPVLLSDVLEATPSGIVRSYIAKFDLMKTMRLLAQANGLNLTKRIADAERSILSVALLQGTEKGTCTRGDLCVARYAQLLREQTWKRTDIYGVTSPHPFHFLHHEDSGLGRCAVTRVAFDVSTDEIISSVGPFLPYLASVTDSRLPQPHDYLLPVKSTTLEKLVKLQYLPGYAVERGGPFEALLRNLMSAVTDFDPSLLQRGEEVDTQNYIYRYNSSMIKRGGMVNGLFTAYSHFDTVTDPLGVAVLGDGRGKPIHFQSLFSSVQHWVLAQLTIGEREIRTMSHFFGCTDCVVTKPVDRIEGPEDMRHFSVSALTACTGLWVAKERLDPGLSAGRNPRVQRPMKTAKLLTSTQFDGILAWNVAKCMVLEEPVDEKVLETTLSGVMIDYGAFWRVVSNVGTLLLMAEIFHTALKEDTLKKYSTVSRDFKAMASKLIGRLPSELLSYFKRGEQQASMRARCGWGWCGQGETDPSLFLDFLASCVTFHTAQHPALLPIGIAETDTLRVLQCYIMLDVVGEDDLDKLDEYWKDVHRGVRLLGCFRPGAVISQAMYTDLLGKWCRPEARSILSDAVDKTFSLPCVPNDWEYVETRPPMTAGEIRPLLLPRSMTSLAEWPVLSTVVRTTAATYDRTTLLPRCLRTRRWEYHFVSLTPLVRAMQSPSHWTIGGPNAATFSGFLRAIGNTDGHLLYLETEVEAYTPHALTTVVDMSGYYRPRPRDWPLAGPRLDVAFIDYADEVDDLLSVFTLDLTTLRKARCLLLGFPAAHVHVTDEMLLRLSRFYGQLRVLRSNLSDGVPRFYIWCADQVDRERIELSVDWSKLLVFDSQRPAAMSHVDEDFLLILFEGDDDVRFNVSYNMMEGRFPGIPVLFSIQSYRTWLCSGSTRQLDVRHVSPLKRRHRASTRLIMTDADVLRCGIWIRACDYLVADRRDQITGMWVHMTEGRDGLEIELKTGRAGSVCMLPPRITENEEFRVACACLSVACLSVRNTGD